MNRGHLPRGSVVARPEEFHPDVLDYLGAVGRAADDRPDAAYVPDRPGLFAGPRRGWALQLAGGTALAAAAAAVVAATGPLADQWPRAAVLGAAAALAGGAALAVVAGMARRRRAARPFDAAAFHACDCYTLWAVAPGRVAAVPLARLTDVAGTRHHTNGVYTHTHIRLWFRDHGRPYDLTLRDAGRSEQLYAALQSRRTGRAWDANYEDPPAPILLPADDRPAPPAGWLRSGVVAAAAAAVLAAAAGVAALDCHAYATRTAGPGGLRRYLADPLFHLHRAEARGRLAAYYERAVADLRGRAAAVPPSDRPLFDTLLAVVEAKRDASDPAVPVRFAARTDETPDAAGLAAERANVELYKEVRNIRAALGDRAGADALLPRGDTFAAAHVVAREDVILDRLAAAVTRAVGADILTFRRAAAGEAAAIDIGYCILAPGDVYSQREHREPRRFKHLLRGYAAAWAIAVRPAGGAAATVEFDSHALTNLMYDPRPGDPDWAPYAVLQYSGFYDMGDNLVRRFGLEPDAPRTSFTFALATGDRTAAEGPR